MTIATFLLAMAASMRLTRLITEDTITQGLRDRLARRAVRRDHDRRRDAILWAKAYEWATCPWCAGMWTAAAVSAYAAISDGAGWFTYPAIALTISYLIGVAATIMATIESINE